TSTDYWIMALIPAGAMLFVRPGVTWRWLLYYGVLGAIPFVREMDLKLEISYRIYPGMPYEFRVHKLHADIFNGVYVPCFFLFLKIVVATVVLGLVFQRAKANSEETEHAQ